MQLKFNVVAFFHFNPIITWRTGLLAANTTENGFLVTNYSEIHDILILPQLHQFKG